MISLSGGFAGYVTGHLVFLLAAYGLGLGGFSILLAIVSGLIGQTWSVSSIATWFSKERDPEWNYLGDAGFQLSWIGFAILMLDWAFSFRWKRHVGMGVDELFFCVIALPGLYCSWRARRHTYRFFANCGVVLGTVTCLSLAVYLLRIVWHARDPAFSFFVLAVLLAVFGIGAVFATHRHVGDQAK